MAATADLNCRIVLCPGVLLEDLEFLFGKDKFALHFLREHGFLELGLERSSPFFASGQFCFERPQAVLCPAARFFGHFDLGLKGGHLDLEGPFLVLLQRDLGHFDLTLRRDQGRVGLQGLDFGLGALIGQFFASKLHEQIALLHAAPLGRDFYNRRARGGRRGTLPADLDREIAHQRSPACDGGSGRLAGSGRRFFRRGLCQRGGRQSGNPKQRGQQNRTTADRFHGQSSQSR